MQHLTHSLRRPCCRHSVAVPAGITTTALTNSRARSRPQSQAQLPPQQLRTHQQQSRGFISLSSLFTSSSETITTKTQDVSDAEVYTLAQHKQHPLSLGDLIKYVYALQSNLQTFADLVVDTAARHSPRSHSFALRTSHSPSSQSVSHIAFKLSATFRTSSSPTQTSPEFTATISIPSPFSYHTGSKLRRATLSPISRMRSASPRRSQS